MAERNGDAPITWRQAKALVGIGSLIWAAILGVGTLMFQTRTSGADQEARLRLLERDSIEQKLWQQQINTTQTVMLEQQARMGAVLERIEKKMP